MSFRFLFLSSKLTKSLSSTFWGWMEEWVGHSSNFYSWVRNWQNLKASYFLGEDVGHSINSWFCQFCEFKTEKITSPTFGGGGGGHREQRVGTYFSTSVPQFKTQNLKVPFLEGKVWGWWWCFGCVRHLMSLGWTKTLWHFCPAICDCVHYR